MPVLDLLLAARDIFFGLLMATVMLGTFCGVGFCIWIIESELPSHARTRIGPDRDASGVVVRLVPSPNRRTTLAEKGEVVRLQSRSSLSVQREIKRVQSP